jgi:ferredoxin
MSSKNEKKKEDAPAASRKRKRASTPSIKRSKDEQERMDQAKARDTEKKQAYLASSKAAVYIPRDQFCLCTVSRQSICIQPDEAHAFRAIAFCVKCKLYVSEAEAEPKPRTDGCFVIPEWDFKANKFVLPKGVVDMPNRCGLCSGCVRAQSNLNVGQHVFVPLPLCLGDPKL